MVYLFAVVVADSQHGHPTFVHDRPRYPPVLPWRRFPCDTSSLSTRRQGHIPRKKLPVPLLSGRRVYLKVCFFPFHGLASLRSVTFFLREGDAVVFFLDGESARFVGENSTLLRFEARCRICSTFAV